MAQEPDPPKPPADGSPSQLFPDAGLCAGCVHAAVVRSPRSRFLRCALSDTDPAFPRYPRLPVVACPGFERRGELPR